MGVVGRMDGVEEFEMQLLYFVVAVVMKLIREPSETFVMYLWM